MIFDVYGPFTLKRFGIKKLITNETLDSLISTIEKTQSGLSGACGCYVFGIRAGKGIKPWYVGQANKTTLVKEALNSSNREKYNKLLDDRSGTPVLFLLPRMTPEQNRFAKPTSKEVGLKSIHFLEEWLIASALQRNPELVNDKKTFFLRELSVKGIFNARHGEATTPSTALKKLLGV